MWGINRFHHSIINLPREILRSWLRQMWVCVLAMLFTHLEEYFIFLSLDSNCEEESCGLGMVVHTAYSIWRLGP